MKHTRIIVTRYGGPEVLQVLEEERPEPGPGDVRVKVLAAGVALPDVLAREGVHPETPRPPYFIEEIPRRTNGGVDVVFDPIGGPHLWQSRRALRPGGRVVGYGLSTALRGQGLTSNRPGRRQRFRGTAVFALYIAGGWLLPARKRVVPYSIQTLKRLKPAWFRQDLIGLFDLLQQHRIQPLIAHRFPLAEARQAHEMLEQGGVIGKIVLERDRSEPATV